MLLSNNLPWNTTKHLFSASLLNENEQFSKFIEMEKKNNLKQPTLFAFCKKNSIAITAQNIQAECRKSDFIKASIEFERSAMLAANPQSFIQKRGPGRPPICKQSNAIHSVGIFLARNFIFSFLSCFLRHFGASSYCWRYDFTSVKRGDIRVARLGNGHCNNICDNSSFSSSIS